MKKKNHIWVKIYYGLSQAIPVLGWCIGFLSLEVGFISISGQGKPFYENPVFWGSISTLILGVVVVIIFYLRYDKEFKYINAQLDGIENAEKSILLSIHSLGDENTNVLFKQFNLALQKKVEDKVVVKIIAPQEYTKGRLIGAKQMNAKGIDIRFVKGLEDDDCRFILVDGEDIAFSQQDMHKKTLSKEYSFVHSKTLGKILSDYYDKIWDDKNRTIMYEEYYKNGKEKGMFSDS